MDGCEQSFQELKKQLVMAPILTILEREYGFVIYYDALGQGLGAVLMQYGRVIAYAMVFALKMWRHYLFGLHCDIYTDHKNLKYIFKLKELNMRQRRWIELVSNYDYKFHYHEGKTNKVADTLSRKMMAFAISVEKMPRPLQVNMCNLEIEVIIRKLSTLTMQPTIMEAIKGGQLTDPLMEKFK